MLKVEEEINPPFPENKGDNDLEPSEMKSGQRLLALIRVLEKKTFDLVDYEEKMQDIVSLFNNLIALYSRRGILQGNKTKAERILSTQKTSTARERGGSKRNKRGSSHNNGELRIHHDGSTVDGTDSTGFQQESLVLTAVVRVLNAETSNNKSTTLDDDHALLVALAAELCVAISQYVNTSKESDSCAHAEYELLSQSGKSILFGIINSLRSLDLDVQRHTKVVTDQSPKMMEKCLTMTFLDCGKHIDPINSCLKAAASLVGLFGTKLSRSVTILTDLKTIAWRLLTINDDSIQNSAARLIAMIPMAGGTDRKTPSDLWMKSIADVISMLALIMSTVAPVSKARQINIDDIDITEQGKAVSKMWIDFVRNDLSQESARVLSFNRFLRGLTLCFRSLLSQDGMNLHAHNYGLSSPLSDSKIDVEAILDVIENFVSFSLSAETIFYKTKKRLRNETVDGGLLSPRAVSTLVGNQVKRLGHDIFNCLLESCGGPTLLPFSSRIIRISYASLLTSCSGPLRKVLDPTSAIQLDGKRRKWLHQSVPMRDIAIHTFTIVITLFGSDKRDKLSSSSSSTRRSDGENAIALVAGCLLEEIGKGDGVDGSDDDTWGTHYERTRLIHTALECLQAVLVSCGGFLVMPIRSMIDSSVMSGLVELNNILLSCSEIKIALLNLASCCITTPWNDGSSSSIVDPLVQAATQESSCCGNNTDAKVCMAAKAVLKVCESLAVPRAPALLYISRAKAVDSFAPAPSDARSLIQKIKEAQTEMKEADKKLANAKNVEKTKKEREKRLRRILDNEAEGERKTKPVSKRTKTEPSSEEVPRFHMQETVPEEKASPGNSFRTKKKNGTNLMEAETKMTSTKDDEEMGDISEDPVLEEEEEEPMETVESTPSESSKAKQEAQESDEEFGFPDIVRDGGPDSDDE